MSDSVWPHRQQPIRLPCPWDCPGKNTGVGCHFLLQCMKVKRESEVAQSCPTQVGSLPLAPPGNILTRDPLVICIDIKVWKLWLGHPPTLPFHPTVLYFWCWYFSITSGSQPQADHKGWKLYMCVMCIYSASTKIPHHTCSMQGAKWK